MATQTVKQSRQPVITEINTVLDEVDALADSLQSQLYQMGLMVQLAAFSCEARRTLSQISEQALVHPTFDKTLKTYVDAAHNWSEFPDVSGEVLQAVAHQIGTLGAQIDKDTQHVRDLRKATFAE